MKKDWTKEELEKDYVGKMRAITLPVNISFSGKQKILAMKELEELLRNADIIAQGECECRIRMGNCIDPMDGCLGVGSEGRDWIEEGKAKRISVEEALEAMRRTHDAGLVHMAFIFEDKQELQWICSCCSCCCHSLSAALRFGYEDHVFSSKFIATQDSDKCANCGVCADRCQFGAREIVDDELIYSQEKCFGCGVCLDTCPEDAIEMVERA